MEASPGGVSVQTGGGDREPGRCHAAWSRCVPRKVHIGRNRCKSATRAADSQGHDWTPIYSISRTTHRGLCYIWAWSEGQRRCKASAVPLHHKASHGRYAMTQVIALSLSIAVLGGIWAFLALGPLSGFVLVWAGFIGWGCFFHSGANTNALVKTIIGNAYGALVAWVALLIIVNVPVPSLGAVWPAIVVGVTVFFLVVVASIDLLSVVPANVYGYAALVAYSLHQPSAAPATGPLQNLVSPSFANPLVLLIVSMGIGALFGYASDQLAKVLPTKLPTRAAHA